MSRLLRTLGLVAMLLSGAAGSATANPEALAREINLTASAATAVIAGLQGKINGATATPADLDAGRLRSAYGEAYARLAGHALDSVVDAPVAEIRRLMEAAMAEVLTQFRPEILRGGEDAFVPAFFRAQLFERFNAAVGGRYRAVATNRRAELINRDSAADRLIDDVAILAYVNGLLEAASGTPVTRAIGERVVGYWPMTITEPCASCHLRGGLRQTVGQYGGATVVVIGR